MSFLQMPIKVNSVELKQLLRLTSRIMDNDHGCMWRVGWEVCFHLKGATCSGCNYVSRVIATCDETPRISQLEKALKTAILAVRSAEQYGEEIGYVVRFDQESVKSMAVTVLIGMQGGRY